VIDQLKYQIENNLPGESAHLEMSPLGRGKSSDALKKADVVKESAVAVHLVNNDGKYEILLTKRADYKGTHGGQISFPGGKKEEADENLLETARRESEEETALPKINGEFIGLLTPIFIPVSGFRVSPFVIYHDTPLTGLNTDSHEVEEIFMFPISNLLSEETIKRVDIPITKEFTLKNVPCYEYEGRIIWGATAIILSELKEILKRIS